MTRTVGARAEDNPGLSKFRRRRTFEAGVEMIISAGRFDIVGTANNSDEIAKKIVPKSGRIVRLSNSLQIFHGEHTTETVNGFREVVQ